MKHSLPHVHAVGMAILITIGLYFTTNSVLAEPKPGRHSPMIHPQWDYLPGRVIVKFKPGLNHIQASPQIGAILGAYNVLAAKPLFTNVKSKSIAEKESIGLSRIFFLRVPESTDIRRMVIELSRHPAVEYAEPDYIIPVAAVPNDPLYGQQQHLPQIKAPQAWDVAKGDSNVVVAIIDTGTDWDHPDLAANIWRNAGEIIDGIDNDGNGFIDDIRGWDFVDNATNVAPGEDGDEPDNNPMDFNGHGTHTSGLASAVTDNGVGVAAISWNVEVMPLRIGWHTTGGNGLGLVSWMAQAFVYAADNGAHVANLSFGSSEIVIDGARYAFERGVVITSSAGNDNQQEPSGLDLAPFAITVAAVDAQDRKTSYTDFGEWVKVAAPGGTSNRAILSTVFNNSYANFYGTSMSAPITAGLAALVKSLHPNWSSAQVTFQVVETADNIDNLNPNYAGKLGTGRINAWRAVTETVTPLPKISLSQITVDDVSGGNGNKVIEEGESIKLVIALQNFWADANNLSATLTTDDWALRVTKGTANYGPLPGLSDLDHNTKSNAADPFMVTVLPEALPHRAHFDLELSAANGYRQSLSFTLAIRPSVLVLDDDDGFNNIESFYTTILDSLNIAFDVHTHLDAGSPRFELMRNYSTVIWLCEWTFPALDSTDRAELRKYLDNGGNLFLSGQDIGWDLCDQNHPGVENEFDRSRGESLLFYETYLHARYLIDDSDFSSLSGVAGDPLSDGLNFNVNQPGRAATEQFPSEIQALAPGVSIFNYPNGKSGAVRFAGAHRVVYFAFGGYEAIVEAQQRRIVMPRVINWLNGLAIEHTPLKDTEDSTASREVKAKITSSVSPVAVADLYWDTDGKLPFNKVVMTPQGGGLYRATIPAQSRVTVEYFIFARTQQGFSSPIQTYSYKVQPDRIPPVVTNLTDLPHTFSNVGSFNVSVEVSDNIGVNTNAVWLLYRTSSRQPDSVKMKPTAEPGRFEGTIAGRFAFGDTVFYSVSARDIAAAGNRGVSAEKWLVVGLDDFERGLDNWTVAPNGWGLSQLRRVSGLSSANSNPAGAGTYGRNVNTSLTSAISLDLSALSKATLSFMEQHTFAANQEDFGVVEISADEGKSWTALSEQYRGLVTQWQARNYSLAGFVGAGFDKVRVRFRVQTDSTLSPALRGWFIDDVKIIPNVAVAVHEPAVKQAIPLHFGLSQNYPNPFSLRAHPAGTTLIRFELPMNAHVEMTIYDLLGRYTATLLNGPKTAGVHTVEWDGKEASGQKAANGIYFYRLKALSSDGRQEFQMVRKMVVLE